MFPLELWIIFNAMDFLRNRIDQEIGRVKDGRPVFIPPKLERQNAIVSEDMY